MTRCAVGNQRFAGHSWSCLRKAVVISPSSGFLRIWGHYSVFLGLLILVVSVWDCLYYCCSEVLSCKSSRNVLDEILLCNDKLKLDIKLLQVNKTKRQECGKGKSAKANGLSRQDSVPDIFLWFQWRNVCLQPC